MPLDTSTEVEVVDAVEMVGVVGVVDVETSLLRLAVQVSNSCLVMLHSALVDISCDVIKFNFCLVSPSSFLRSFNASMTAVMLGLWR